LNLTDFTKDFAKHKLFFENYAKDNGFDPFVPENWYFQTAKNILTIKVLNTTHNATCNTQQHNTQLVQLKMASTIQCNPFQHCCQYLQENMGWMGIYLCMHPPMHMHTGTYALYLSVRCTQKLPKKLVRWYNCHKNMIMIFILVVSCLGNQIK
jgi:hypothetical protein